MNRALLDKIVNATLYEGYILYPYRASSCKNARERFTFGRVYPEAYSVAQNGAERCMIQAECLAKAGADASVDVSVRFLHPMVRESEDGQTPPWLEAVEREVAVSSLSLSGSSKRETDFDFPSLRQIEPRPFGEKGLVVRRQAAIKGAVGVLVRHLAANLFNVTVRVHNLTPFDAADLAEDDAVLMRLLASTHVILRVEHGEFVSQMDPPPELAQHSTACHNIGVWPVLVGDESLGERDTMLASPIILYDYPKIAPESAGQLFDGTEIDELLTLRILTMSDAEKREMRHVDAQARRLLERTEALPNEALLKMHGTIRGATPVEFDDFFGPATRLEGVSIGGVWVKVGDRVRVRPKGRADILDSAVAGRTAIVEAVEEDLEHRVQVAVVLESDPGKDLGMLRQPGHRFFYRVDEVEPMPQGVV